MKRIIIYLILIINSVLLFGQSKKTLYDFKFNTINGEEYDVSQLKGKKVLIVNTASKCGFTPQYEDLQALYEKYGGEKFTIIAFPANNFLNQEPGSNEEIESFCRINYGVTFPVMDKISVKGDDIHPLYAWLTNKEENGKIDTDVQWNFQKFMINEKGEVVGFAKPKTKPFSDEIVDWITGNIE